MDVSIVMTKSTRRFLNILLMSLASFGLANAGDQLIPVPQGWAQQPHSAPYDFSPNGAAVVVFQYSQGNPGVVEKSRVLQIVNSAQYETDFLGRVTRVQYSPDGSILLVHQFHPDLASGLLRISAVDQSGTVLWSIDDQRIYQFSTTGEVIYSHLRPESMNHSVGTEIRIHDIQGTVTNRIDSSLPIKGTLVLGTGDQVILGVGRSVVRMDVSTNPNTTVWKFDLNEYDTKMVGLRLMDSDRFLVEQEYGRFLILTLTGQLIYRFNAEYLAVQPGAKRNWGGYAKYKAFAQSATEKILFFDGTSDGLELNPQSGSIGQRIVNAEASPGSSVKSRIAHDKILILEPNQVRLRGLSY